MTDSITYNIPASMAESYRGRNVIVRSHDPAEIVGSFSEDDLERLAYIQLLSLNAEVDYLVQWGGSVPVDLLMRNPETEFPLLYQLSDLLDNHPVRVSIPIVPGLSKAAKLAISLNFAVKLEVVQRLDQQVIEELGQVLDLYLHRPNVAAPVEFFHSTFLALYHREDTSLWSIQEEDPAQFLYITDDGQKAISRRFAGASLTGDLSAFVSDYQRQLLAEKRECDGCEFFDVCGGYFKLPDKQYQCDGVKSLFRTLKEAAGQLQHDLEMYQQAQGG
jgi:sulfatase maturation enzyme AslB (radical SAM superfamily)